MMILIRSNAIGDCDRRIGCELCGKNALCSARMLSVGDYFRRCVEERESRGSAVWEKSWITYGQAINGLELNHPLGVAVQFRARDLHSAVCSTRH